MKRNVHIFPDTEILNRFAAEKFISLGNEAIERNDVYTVSLAGGSTPKSLYKLLSSEQFKNRIDWNKVYFFFGDERNVLPADDESNFRMVYENLFLPLNLPKENVYRWETELKDPKVVAEKYEQSIRNFFNAAENDLPGLDLALLGMGEDAHTASLFPKTAALREIKKIAVANPVEKLSTIRLTLTFPLFNNSRNIIFLVAGENKAEALRRVLGGASEPEQYPAQNINPENGVVYWLIDSEAARFLSGA
jgi:6-phosphogluconolactonase